MAIGFTFLDRGHLDFVIIEDLFNIVLYIVSAEYIRYRHDQANVYAYLIGNFPPIIIVQTNAKVCHLSSEIWTLI